MERAAKTLHRMSPCTPVRVPAKMTLYQLSLGNEYAFASQLAWLNMEHCIQAIVKPCATKLREIKW